MSVTERRRRRTTTMAPTVTKTPARADAAAMIGIRKSSLSLLLDPALSPSSLLCSTLASAAMLASASVVGEAVVGAAVGGAAVEVELEEVELEAVELEEVELEVVELEEVELEAVELEVLVLVLVLETVVLVSSLAVSLPGTAPACLTLASNSGASVVVVPAPPAKPMMLSITKSGAPVVVALASTNTSPSEVWSDSTSALVRPPTIRSLSCSSSAMPGASSDALSALMVSATMATGEEASMAVKIPR